MSKVSIIIAAYNVEEYIAETLNSAIGQTLKDIEIIVVNDCSTDSTPEIIEKFARLDSRIKIVTQDVNNGLVRGRQKGLKNASGEYVMFLDGDDILVPEACEKAYNAIKSENVDILQFDYELFFVPPSQPNPEVEWDFREATASIKHKAISVSRAGLLDNKAIGGVINFTMWDKIYKRTLLETAGALLPDEYLNMAEDVLYSFLIHYHARSYSYISDRLYIYRYGCGMSTTPVLSEKLMTSIAKMASVYEYLNKWVKSVGAEAECEHALSRVHKKTYNSIAGIFLHRVQNSQREFYISEVLKYGDAGELTVGLSNHIYQNTEFHELVAEKCARLSMFSANKTQPKTVGIYYFRVYNGGIENVISTVSDIWVKSGYNVVLFTDEKPNKDDYYINPSIKRVVVPKVTDRSFKNRRDRILSFRKAIIENNVDIMVYNAWISPDLVMDELTVKSCGVNLIIHSHGLFCCEINHRDGIYSHYNSTLPKLYALADSVVALTDVDTAWWQLMGMRSFKTVNPVQFDLNVKTSPLNGHNMLFVGRISGEKQVIDAIKIAEQVREQIPDAKLTVVGKGDDAGYVKTVNDYITENKLGSLVDMAGFSSNVLPYYQSSDVLISTSRCEGFGLALMESKMCGVPLVMYELPNLDITRECKGMTVVAQSDIQEAAEAIIRIFTDDDLKKRMGQEARKSVEEFYSIDLAKHWEGIFTQTLLPKPASAPLRQLPASEVAVRIAVDNYSEGILLRTRNAAATVAYDSSAGNARCAELERELERFKRSESYRIGMIVTFIPRMIKKLLKKIFRRA